MIDREAALADPFDRASSMVMATGRPETGDAALRHILHVLELALQDQRHLGVETACRASRGAAGFRNLGLADGFRLAGGALGLGELLFERGDALLISLLHVGNLGANGGQVGIVGGMRAERGSQHGRHGKTFLHEILLKIAHDQPRPNGRIRSGKRGNLQESGGPRWLATGAGQAAREWATSDAGTHCGKTTGGRLTTEGKAAPRSCAARHSWQTCVGKPSSRLAACSTACAPASNWPRSRAATRRR